MTKTSEATRSNAAKTTAMRTASKATSRAPGGFCRLTLTINGDNYSVRPLPADFVGIRAFRLTKRDGEAHDVARHAHGAECTCGDRVFRRDGIDPKGCKHIRAARAVGLID